MNILVVDDEADVATSTAELLELYNHRATPIFDWKEVIPCITKGDYDLVLQDMKMPGLVLPDLIANVRKVSDARVVLFTANRILDADAAALDVDGLLFKPFDAKELAAIID